MKLTKREKRKNPRTNRKEFCYKCDDGVWRFLLDLVGICEIKNKTEAQMKIILRTRITSWGLNDDRVLGPIDKTKSKASGGGGNPDWGGLTGKYRPDNVVGPGTFER